MGFVEFLVVVGDHVAAGVTVLATVVVDPAAEILLAAFLEFLVVGGDYIVPVRFAAGPIYLSFFVTLVAAFGGVVCNPVVPE